MIPNAVGRSGPQPAGAGPAVMTKREPWQDPPVHPAADKLPMMSDAELAELAADIKANGLLEPIVVWEDNTEAAQGGEGPFPTYLLDGRNRLAALKLLGITDPHDAPKGKGANYGSGWAVKTHKALVATTSGGASTPKWLPEVDPVTYVLSRNVHRRHLTSEQKREAIAAYIMADPRPVIARLRRGAGCRQQDGRRSVRADLEAREEIPHVPTRTDSAGRKQPATKRKPTPKPEATAKPEPIDEDTVAEQPITTEPPGGLTENSPGQTDRVKQALENAKAATGAIEPARDDSAIGPRQMTATPDLTSASCSRASPPISTSWRSTPRRSTPTPSSRWSRRRSTPSTMSPRI